MGDELERFAENTLELHPAARATSSSTSPTSPTSRSTSSGRHVLVVVRGVDYKDDLELLRRSGYLQEMRPLLVGVDGGADALLEIGLKPDVIIGDMDSVSERTLRCGAALVVHGYADGRAARRRPPRRARACEYTTCSRRPARREDIAMLLAYEKGAELIVAVGTTARWSSSSTRAVPAWRRRSSCA